MKSIQHLFLISFGLFSCVCDLAMSRERREKLTGDEEVEYFVVDKHAIRHERRLNEIDADDDGYITLQDIMTYFDGKECVSSFSWYSNGFKKYDQCTTDGEASGYKWCSIETDESGLHKEGFRKYCKEEDTRAAWNNALASLDTDNDGRLSLDETIDFSLELCDNAVASVLNNKCRPGLMSSQPAFPNLWFKKDDKCMHVYTNPRSFDETNRRDSYVKQVRPCGYYQNAYKDSGCVHEWSYTILEPNVDYPGVGKDGDVELDALYLTRFDVGRHAKQPWSSNRNINVTAINFGDGPIDPAPPETIMAAGMTITSETCLEMFTIGGDDFGPIYGDSYDCMGHCGKGCMAWGNAKDCMKHDLCSYYKALIQGSNVLGYAADVDCGDEAAQAVINCWQKRQVRPDYQIVCGDPDTNSQQYTEINPAARYLGRQACLNRTGWDRNQGMPRPWNFPED